MNSMNVTVGNLQTENDENDRETVANKRIRVAIVIVLLACLVFVVIDSFTGKRLQSASMTFFSWVEANPFLGIIAVITLYILATVLFVPGSILTVGCGFAFGGAFESTAKGVALASTAVFFGASLGSIASFLLGRYLFRDCVLRLASKYPVFQAVDRALQGNGLKIMILLRLSPLIPYNALDYMSGITSIPLWAYTAALAAMLPGIVMFTYIGATASSLVNGAQDAAEGKPARIFSMVFGISFAIIGVSVASYYSKVELDKILEGSDEESTSNTPLKHDAATVIVRNPCYEELQQTDFASTASPSFV